MKSFLIIDIRELRDNELKKIIRKIEHYPFGSADKVLYLGFVDDVEGKIVKWLNINLSSVNIEILNPTELMDEFSIEFRDKVSNFIYATYDKWLKLAYSIDDKVGKFFSGMWWYSEISEKNSLADDVWWLWFHFYIITKELNKDKIGRIYYIGNKRMGKLLSQFCKNNSIHYYSIFTIKEMASGITGFLKTFMHRLLVCFSMFFTVCIAKYIQGHGKLYKSGAGGINFYTWYPRVWRLRNNRWQDMYYGKLIELMREKKHCVRYILRFYDQKCFIKPGVIISKFRRLTRDRNALKDCAVLEGFLMFFDIFLIFFDFRSLFLYSKLLKKKESQRLFLFDNIDLAQLFIPLIRRSILISWPLMQLLERAAKRVAEVTQPRLTGLYCFEFIYGKAITRGTRSVSNMPIVALQHGPITYMKFLYAGLKEELCSLNAFHLPMPMPDYLIVDGQLAKKILIERGYPEQKIFICGPVRFDGLWNNASLLTHKRRGQGKIKILIAPGLHDTDFVLRFVLNGINKNNKLRIFIKSHPKVPLKHVKAISERICISDVHYEIVSGNIYDWFKQVDILITTYSSTGVEALAFGLPVIIIRSARIPDMSPFFNSNHDVAMHITDPVDFNKIGDFYNLVISDNSKHLESFFIYNFAFLDSGSGYRALNVIENILK